MEKELLIQFFHERTYSPQPLEEFEREAERAAKLGAHYVYIAKFQRIIRTGMNIRETISELGNAADKPV